MAAPVFGTIGYYLIMLLVTSIIIAFIMMLLRTITCGSSSLNLYERFENQGDTMTEKTKQIQSGIKKIENAIEKLDEDVERVCDVFDKVEDGYVGERASPSDESEFQLPPDEQTARSEKRKKRAKEGFKEKLREKGPVLECFASSNAQEELQDAINDYNSLIKGSEYKNALQKIEKATNTLKFNSTYLKKALDIMGDSTTVAKNTPSRINKTKEGFTTESILSDAEKIIQEIPVILKKFNDVHVVSLQHSNAVKNMNESQKETTSGSSARQQYDDQKEELSAPSSKHGGVFA